MTSGRGEAACPFRRLCTAHAAVSCREAQQDRMAEAISRCPGAACFAVFRDLRAGRDVRDGTGVRPRRPGRHRGTAVTVSRARKLAVLVRDGWQCRMPACLCPDGRRIGPEAPGAWSGTVDHVIPKAAGGPDREDNLRAAHQRCNWAARGPQVDEARRQIRRSARRPAADPYDRIRQAERDRSGAGLGRESAAVDDMAG